MGKDGEKGEKEEKGEKGGGGGGAGAGKGEAKEETAVLQQKENAEAFPSSASSVPASKRGEGETREGEAAKMQQQAPSSRLQLGIKRPRGEDEGRA